MQGVSHRYTDAGGRVLTVLDGVSLRVSPGECVALTGESGSGKSTVARLLLGLERPSEGRILLEGSDVTHWSPRQWKGRRSRIQAVFQDASGTLNPRRSVYHSMEEGLVNLTRMGPRERKSTIYELMELFRLDRKILKTSPRQLSGGEQRRTSLVRALALRPGYLVLDEVTSGLDALSTEAVLTTLERYRERFGCAYLFITHDKACSHRLADRILQLSGGRLTRLGERIKPELNGEKGSTQ